MTVLAMDLGGTRLKAGLVDPATGGVGDFTTAPTLGADGDEALTLMEKVADGVLDGAGVEAVGLSVPGIVDGGRITALPGKFDGIVGIDLQAWSSAVLGSPAVVVNDAVAYGAGEAHFGAGAGAHRATVVTIGTGVGVSVFERGRPVAGGPFGAGILGGQIPIGDADSGPSDTSGRRGTIEARCAASSLTAYAEEAGLHATAVEDVYAAFASGDPAAAAALETYRGWLARGLIALAHAHTPDVIVLGGGPMRAGNPVAAGLKALISDRLWAGYDVDIRVAALGDTAALSGVAHLAAGGRGP